MGSFDVTCIASHMRIACGEQIYAVILVCRDETTNWDPVGLPILGEYNDYGRIILDNPTNGEVLMNQIRKWLVPREGFDPATADFDVLQDQCWDECFVKHSLSANEAETTEYYPYSVLNKALIEAGFQHKAKPIGQPDSNILTLSTAWTPMVQIEALEAIIRDNGYEVMRIAAVQASRDVLFEDRKVFDLLLAPKADHETAFTFLGYQPTRPNRRIKIGFIRKDFYDRMVPDSKLLFKAEEVAHLLKKNSWFQNLEERASWEIYSYIPTMILRDLDLFGVGDNYGIAQKILEQYIVSLPKDPSPEQLLRLVRYDRFCLLMKYRLAVGIRPTPFWVGSQCASQDWPTQRQAHKICDEILRDLISKRNEDSLLVQPLEYEAFLDITPTTFCLED
jgi:hypothetical protein